MIAKNSERQYEKKYKESVTVKATPEQVFKFADNHMNFSSHMNRSSIMLGGGKMETVLDEGRGQRVGSHVVMTGKAFGLDLFLDEVIVKRLPPKNKEWRTVGNLKLYVIGHYLLGFNIESVQKRTRFEVYIKYNFPNGGAASVLGIMFGRMYARWCVRQMIKTVSEKFS